ncbi:hypothetical protein HMPREF1110_0357 [Streptococcus mitis SK579]|nr:hypothetical protein HMPREF1110_0357 [Streptococcus mitis SK579]
MLICIKSVTSSFNPNQFDFFISYILRKSTNGIGTTTYTGNNVVWQASFFFQDLTTRFFTDDLLELVDNGWIRVRTYSRTQNIESFKVIHPCSKGCINRILKSSCPRFNCVNSCSHHLHTENIETLTLHIFCPHVDITGHTKLGCSRCCRNTVLTSSCFRNHSFFAHAFSKKDLSQNIVKFVRTQVIKIFTLEINLSPT